MYFPQVDRFLVTCQTKSVRIETLLRSKRYSSVEYLRYIPDRHVSFGAMDNFLEQYPQEICCEITNACNFSCAVCLADSPGAKTTQMPRGVYTKILGSMPPSVKRVTLTGGEPTLHPRLPEMLGTATAAVKGVVLSTNGSLPKKLEAALVDNSGIIVAISVHGSKAEHDAFVGCQDAYERGLESIEIAAVYAEAVQIHTTVVPQTVKGLPKLCETLAELPIKEHRLNLVKPRGRRLASAVPYDSVRQSIANVEVPYKMSVKKREQPFLFVSCEGKKEIRHVRKCKAKQV